MREELSSKIERLLLDGNYRFAASIATPNELREILKYVVDKGLIQEAEMCAKRLKINLSIVMCEKILLKALENTWIYTFFECERKIFRRITPVENTTMLSGCIKNGWLKESDIFAKRLGRHLREDEIEEIMCNCVLFGYWVLAEKCANRLPDPKKTNLLKLISRSRPKEESSNFSKLIKLEQSIWQKSAV